MRRNGVHRRIDIGVRGQNKGNDLRFVLETFGEQGRIGRSIIRLFKTSRSEGLPSRLKIHRDLAGCVIFAVINGEWEEIQPFPGSFARMR
jgi:hypothetical protein